MEVLLSLDESLVCGEEVGDELFSRLVHDTPDHGLGHHVHLLGRGNTSRGGVRVEYDLNQIDTIKHDLFSKNSESDHYSVENE